jgi:protein-arginine kinase
MSVMVHSYEREARRVMLERNRRMLEDRVYRGVATLRAARMLGLEEAMKQLSSVRPGRVRGIAAGHSAGNAEPPHDRNAAVAPARGAPRRGV